MKLKVKVINLDRDVARLDWMRTQLDAHELPFERFAALTPENIPENLRTRFHANAAQLLSKGEIGCFASHLRLAQELLESDDPVWLVLEDDVELGASGAEFQALAAASLDQNIVKLNDWPKTPSLELKRVGRHRLVRYWAAPRGTGAHFLTRTGAFALLRAAHGLATVADDFFRKEAHGALRISGVTPPPAIQDRFGESSLDPRKQRQKQRSRPLFHQSPDKPGRIGRARAQIDQFGWRDTARMISAYAAMKARRVKRDVEMRHVLPPASPALHTHPPRLHIVAHNRNHVRIFLNVAADLASRGVDLRFATIEGHDDQPFAAKALREFGHAAVDVGVMERDARPQDVVCVGNDWGPKRLRSILDRLQARGVRLMGVIEGARFSFPKQYARVDEVLCWGPSGKALFERPARVVGSPAIENAQRLARRPRSSPHVLINYKFAYGAEDAGFAWGEAAIRAAESIDPNYVVSAHPASRGVPDHANVSHAPFHQHLGEAWLLITRSSTVIYEALAVGVAVIYFPIESEKRAEFGDSRGAFATAESADELFRLTQAFAANPAFDATRAAAFLNWHLSIDSARPAATRIADALSEVITARTAVH